MGEIIERDQSVALLEGRGLDSVAFPRGRA